MAVEVTREGAVAVVIVALLGYDRVGGRRDDDRDADRR